MKNPLFAFFIVVLVFYMHSVSGTTPVNETSESSIHFSMDSCSAWILAGTRNDYSEFTPVTSISPGCSELSVVGGHLYRTNPEINYHSCTPGINDSPAMCISSDNSCSYNKGDEKSLRLDVLLTPGESGLSGLSSLTFFERAPDTFQYIDGPSGLNNFPTMFALRILKNGQEVYTLEDMPTQRDWNFRDIRLDTVDALQVDTTTLFRIELLAYCLVDNGGNATAWDIDEMTLTSTCSTNIPPAVLTSVSGETELTVCASENQFSPLPLFSLSGLRESFDTLILLVTDSQDSIIHITRLTLFDTLSFNAYGPNFGIDSDSIYRVYQLQHEGPIQGLQVRNFLFELEGCYALSNPFSLYIEHVRGGKLTTSQGNTGVGFCLPPGGSQDVTVFINGAEGNSEQYVMTDASGNILNIVSSPTFTITDNLPDPVLIYHIVYNGSISGLAAGNNIDDLAGCYALSNEVKVHRENQNGGVLSLLSGSTDTTVCLANGFAGPLDVKISGITGIFSGWIITDEDLNIIATPNAPPFNLSGYTNNVCLIWHITYNDIFGLAVGGNAGTLEGCYALSNAIRVNKQTVNAGFISVMGEGFIRLCDTGSEDLNLVVDTINVSGEKTALVVTTPTDSIVDVQFDYSIDFEDRTSGTYFIHNLAYNGILTGLNPGLNLDDLSASCMAFSNVVTVVKETAIAGNISVNGRDEAEFCVFNGQAAPITIDLLHSTADFFAWLVLDDNGNILEIKNASSFAIDDPSRDDCVIRYLAYGISFTGLGIGNNISAFEGCYSLSNEIELNKKPVDGGVLTIQGADSLFLCTPPGNIPDIPYDLLQISGEGNVLMLTDETGLILELVTGSSIDLSSYTGGTYNLVNVSYNGVIQNAAPGQNISEISSACFTFSNTLKIELTLVDGGVLTTSMGEDIELCQQGNDDVLGIVSLNLSHQRGSFSTYLVTDENGFIISRMSDPFVLADSIQAGTCFIYHLSYEPGTAGFEIGSRISNITGCYDLSAPVRIRKTYVEGGTLLVNDTTSATICVAGGIHDVPQFTIAGNVSPQFAWVITETDGTILETGNTPPVNFDNLNGGSCLVYFVSYTGAVSGLDPGTSLADLNGCFDLSNPVVIIKNKVEASIIRFGDGSESRTRCIGDGIGGFEDIDFISDGEGDSRWVITDTTGTIIRSTNSFLISFENAGPGTCLIWRLNFSGQVEGLDPGGHISDITGCYQLSNALSITREEIIRSSITFVNGETDTTLCVGTGLEHLIEVESIAPGNGNVTYLLLDPSGSILEWNEIGVFDLTNAPAGTCIIRKVNYLDSLGGLAVNNHESDLEGCLVLSNRLRVDREELSDPTIEFAEGGGERIYCLDDGIPVISNVHVAGRDGSGIWILTDESGTITRQSVDLPIHLTDSVPGKCYLWFINHNGPVQGLGMGLPVLDIKGCYKLSNALIIKKKKFVSEQSVSSLCFDMEACNAIIISEDNKDYSEFTAEISNDDACTQLSVIGDHLYRLNPEVNLHSCAPGINNSTAMCVSAVDDCDFVPGSEKAVRFDILVTPGSNNFGNISKLMFYQRAPKAYNFINGQSGANNYPLRYGIRILKDNIEVYRNEDLPTSRDYTLEEFDFTGLAEFTVYEPAVYSFEITAYCLIGTNGLVEIWDLDDIKLVSDCESDLTGGVLTAQDGNNSIDVCSADGIPDSILVQLTEAQGPAMSWILTDSAGVIIDLPVGPPFNFEGTGPGLCFLYSISYVHELQGLQPGIDIGAIQGCFRLSSSLQIVKKNDATCEVCTADGGNIFLNSGSDSINICVDDGMSNELVWHTENEDGEVTLFVVTDESGIILEVLDDPRHEFEGMQAGRYYITQLAYNGSIANLEEGLLLSGISGCHNLSNSIVVIAETVVSGGCASFTDPSDQGFIVSPNPVSGIMNIRSDMDPDPQGKLIIYNKLGQVMFQRELLVREVDVPVIEWPDGMYYLQIYHANKRYNRVFIKM